MKSDFIQQKHVLFVWILMGVEKVDSLNALEKIYYPEHFVDDSPSLGNSRIFCRIVNGNQSLGKKTMGRILKRHPRASYWFELPLWEICTEQLKHGRIEELLSISDKSLIVPKLFHYNKSGHFIRKKGRAVNVDAFIRYLILRPSWDSLSILLLLVTENTYKRFGWLGLAYLKAAYFMLITLLAQLSLAKQKVFQELGKHLRHLINKQFRCFFNDYFPVDDTTSEELVEFFPVFEHYLNQSELIRSRDNEIPLCKHRYNFFLLTPEQRKSVMNEIKSLVAKSDFSPSHFTHLALIQTGEFNIKF